MNREEFDNLYGHLFQKQKVLVECSCGRERTISKEKAINNFDNHNGEYVCRSCSMRESHHANPMTDATKTKIADSLKGIKRSKQTRKLMSLAMTNFYRTEDGIKARKKLAKLSAKQNATKKPTKSKRIIHYISAKNGNQIRTCASSYEYIACEDFLEKDEDVVGYETQVWYEANGRNHTLDFLITYKDGRKKVIEVKPSKMIKRYKKHRQQLYDSCTNARFHGWDFEIWTEERLKIINSKQAKDRADEYNRKKFKIDYSEYKRMKNNEKSKRYREKHYDDLRLTIFCQWCQKEHTVRRYSYDANIERNGRYICGKEGGHISGSKSKKNVKCTQEIALNSLANEIETLNEVDSAISDGHGIVIVCKNNKTRDFIENLVTGLLSEVDNQTLGKLDRLPEPYNYYLTFETTGLDLESVVMSMASSIDAASCDVPELYKSFKL